MPDAREILQRANEATRREIARLLHVPYKIVRCWKGTYQLRWRKRQIEALVELELITLPPWLH